MTTIELSAHELPVVAFAGSLDGACTYVNAEWTAVTGQEPEEAFGSGWAQAVHPEDRPRVLRDWHAALAAGARVTMEFRMLRADETPLHVLCSVGPNRDPSPGCEWVATLTDVTEKQALTDQLAEAQRIAKLGHWQWDIQSGALAWSDEIYRIFGLTPQAFGASYDAFLERVHPADREAVSEAVQSAVENRSRYAIRHRVVHPDGTSRLVQERGRVHYAHDGTPQTMLGTVQDVTTQHLLMAELDHRVKNNLAMVVALARQSLMREGNDVDSVEAFILRLDAMSHAHEVLSKSRFESADLGTLLALIIPGGLPQDRSVTLAGPAVRLGPEVAVPLCLSIHELFTNALKHGALSIVGGRMAAEWSKRDGTLRIVTTESGGPPPRPDAPPGFGTSLIQALIEHQLQGVFTSSLDPSGAKHEIRIPMKQSAATTGPPPPPDPAQQD